MRKYKEKFFGNGNYPMPNVDAKYFKNVKSLNLEDLKTKYLMAFIINWSQDSNSSGSNIIALKYMNGKYWIRNNYNGHSYNDEAVRETYRIKQTWKPISLRDLEVYYNIIDGVIEEYANYGEGRNIFVIPYSAKGLHGHKTSTPTSFKGEMTNVPEFSHSYTKFPKYSYWDVEEEEENAPVKQPPQPQSKPRVMRVPNYSKNFKSMLGHKTRAPRKRASQIKVDFRKMI